MVGRQSLLELLHPAGAPEGARALGGGCPSDLAPTHDVESAVDLVVLAPGPREHDVVGLADEAIHLLRPGGIVAVVGPPKARRSAARRLVGAGLAARMTFAHLAAGPTTALVSVEGDAARVAAEAGAGRRARLLSIPVLRAAGSPRGVATLVLAPPGAELAGWLRPAGVAALDGLFLRPSWRGPGGSVIVTGISRGRPVVVGKLGLGAEEAGLGEAEAAALGLLGPSARSAGAVVPDVLGRATVGMRAAALLSAVPGGNVAARVRGRSAALAAAERVSLWLVRWCGVTREVCSAARTVATEVSAPLEELASDVGSAYVDAVRRIAADVGAAEGPLCARHGDLTLWNVMEARHASLAIVDWEGGRARALPLTDLPYLLVDAVDAEHGYRDRAGAYTACFTPGGRRAHWAASIVQRAAASVGLTAAQLELAMHACWLGHAADERRRGLTDGPFLRVLRLHAGARW